MTELTFFSTYVWNTNGGWQTNKYILGDSKKSKIKYCAFHVSPDQMNLPYTYMMRMILFCDLNLRIWRVTLYWHTTRTYLFEKSPNENIICTLRCVLRTLRALSQFHVSFCRNAFKSKSHRGWNGDRGAQTHTHAFIHEMQKWEMWKTF